MILPASLPLLVPALAITTLAALVAAPAVSRALAVSRLSAFAIGASVGLVLAATLTPLGSALDGSAVGSGACDLSRTWIATLDELVAVRRNDRLVNILLFVPLGLTVGLARARRNPPALVVAVVALPFALEAIQLALPALARSCESADVVDNLTGLAIGLGCGALLGRLVALVATRD
jgi:hypothetical protein